MREQSTHTPDQTALAANHRSRSRAESRAACWRRNVDSCPNATVCRGWEQPLRERRAARFGFQGPRQAEKQLETDWMAMPRWRGGGGCLPSRAHFKLISSNAPLNGEQVKDPISAKGTNLQCRLEELRIVDARDLFQLA